MVSNFDFLENRCHKLAELGAEAEKLLYNDNNACVVKIGTFAEWLMETILEYEDNIEHINDKQYDRIEYLKNKRVLTENYASAFHKIRMARNKVSHGEDIVSVLEAREIVKLAFVLSVWFVKTYGGYPTFNPIYVDPEELKNNSKQHIKPPIKLREYDERQYVSQLYNQRTTSPNPQYHEKKKKKSGYIFKTQTVIFWNVLFILSIILNIILLAKLFNI